MVLAPDSSSRFVTHQYLDLRPLRVNSTVVQFHDLFSINEWKCNQLKDEPICKSTLKTVITKMLHLFSLFSFCSSSLISLPLFLIVGLCRCPCWGCLSMSFVKGFFPQQSNQRRELQIHPVHYIGCIITRWVRLVPVRESDQQVDYYCGDAVTDYQTENSSTASLSLIYKQLNFH